MMTPGLGLLGLLEKNPIAEVVLKDILGFNLPKIALTRTWKERFDTATLELSNTAITVLGTLSLPWLLNKPTQWLSGVDASFLSNTFKGTLTPKAKLARLAKASGFLFPFAASFWAAPFFRNALTLYKNKTDRFEDIIGLTKEDTGNHDYKKEIKKQIRKGLKVMGIGNALGLVSFFGFGIAAKRFTGKSLGSVTSFLHKTFQLMGKKGDQVNRGVATLLFWLWPAYGGWLHAARGENEYKEQLLKAANGTLWFSLITPMVVDPIFAKRMQGLMERSKHQLKDKTLLTNLWNKNASWWNIWEKINFPSFEALAKEGQLRPALEKMNRNRWGVGLGLSIVLLSAMPQVLNWVLTRRRFKAQHGGEHLQANRTIQPQLVSPFSTFLLKSPQRLAQSFT